MESEKRRLFVGGISWETSEATLREHFSKYGEVEDTSLITDKRTGHGRGFGFMSFKDPDMANQALKINMFFFFFYHSLYALYKLSSVPTAFQHTLTRKLM